MRARSEGPRRANRQQHGGSFATRDREIPMVSECRSLLAGAWASTGNRRVAKGTTPTLASLAQAAYRAAFVWCARLRPTLSGAAPTERMGTMADRPNVAHEPRSGGTRSRFINLDRRTLVAPRAEHVSNLAETFRRAWCVICMPLIQYLVILSAGWMGTVTQAEAATLASNCIENGGQYMCTSIERTGRYFRALEFSPLVGDAGDPALVGNCATQYTAVTGISQADLENKEIDWYTSAYLACLPPGTTLASVSMQAPCYEPMQFGGYYGLEGNPPVSTYDPYLGGQKNSNPGCGWQLVFAYSDPIGWPDGSFTYGMIVTSSGQDAVHQAIQCPFGQPYGDNVTEPTICIEWGIDPKDAGEPQCPKAVGNPMDYLSGNKYQLEIDYAHPRGLLRVARSFNSLSAPTSTSMGTVWANDYDKRIEVRTGSVGTVANAFRGTGKVLHYIGTAFVGDADSKLNLTAIKDGTGATTGYSVRDLDKNRLETYDASGRLVKISTADGYYVTLAYNSTTGWLASVTDVYGATITFTQDPVTGEILSFTDPAGGVYSYTYDSVKRITSVTYPDQKSKQYTFNTNGLLTGIIDESGKQFATFTYQNSTDDFVQRKAFSVEHAVGVDKYSVTWPTAGQASLVDPLGTASTTSFGYINNVAVMTRRTQSAGAGCNASASSFYYDQFGNVIGTDDFSGKRTCWGFSGPGREAMRVQNATTSYSCPQQTGDSYRTYIGANANFTMKQWHPNWSLVSALSEPSIRTTFVYNGQPDPFNGGSVASCAPTTATLDDGSPIAVVCKMVRQATSDVTGINGFGAAFDTTLPNRTWTWTYNANGEELTSTEPLNGQSNKTYYTDSTSTHSVGDLYTSTDAAGHTTTYAEYDKNGNVLKVIDARGVTSTLTYDPRGRLLTSTQRNLTTTYTLDERGLVAKATRPNGTFETYTYDDAHRLLSVQDSVGNTTTYTLDPAGNRLAETYSDGGRVVLRTVTRTFDALGRMQTAK
jgi:YD repeat-containing protein